MSPVESVARWVALVLGIVLVLLTAWSVFTALVVPRVTSSPAMRMLARTLGGSARRIAPRLPNYETRDRVLSFVGPAAMVSLFMIWLCLIVLGVALIEWDAAGVDFATALGISGSSVFTLGISLLARPARGSSRSSPPETTPMRSPAERGGFQRAATQARNHVAGYVRGQVVFSSR